MYDAHEVLSESMIPTCVGAFQAEKSSTLPQKKSMQDTPLRNPKGIIDAYLLFLRVPAPSCSVLPKFTLSQTLSSGWICTLRNECWNPNCLYFEGLETLEFPVCVCVCVCVRERCAHLQFKAFLCFAVVQSLSISLYIGLILSLSEPVKQVQCGKLAF